jgi:hypothetical protein
MVNDPLMVKGPGDTNLPYIDTSYQTIVYPEFIEPGETVELVEYYDVRSQYHIIKPGKYSFQFKDSISGAKPSNIVDLKIKPGILSALESVVEKLKLILSESWTLTRRTIGDIY